MRKAIVLGIALGSSHFALADNDGALPRGPGQPPKRSLEVTTLPKAPEVPDCLEYLATAQSGELLFSPNSQSVYFLSRSRDEFSPLPKTYLYEVDLATYRFKRIVSLRAGENSALVAHGNPISGISIFDFRQGSPNCGEGVSAGIGIQWGAEQKIIKSFPSGPYKIVASDQGPQVADLERRNIVSMDPGSFQKRTLGKLPPKVSPLYFKSSPPTLYGFLPEKRELLRFIKNSSTAEASLALKKDMRLLQQNDQFGVIIVNEKKIQIKLLKGWSGDAFQGFDFPLPEPWTAPKIAAAVDFSSGIFAVFGSTPAYRRELRQVLVYSSAKNDIERIVSAQPGQYFSQVGIDPKGRRLLILSRDLEGDVVSALRIRDLDNGEWREVSFNQESETKSEPNPSPVSPAP